MTPIDSNRQAHEALCDKAQKSIKVGNYDQALIDIEQARTALHPEGVISSAKCEHLAALCNFALGNIEGARYAIADARRLAYQQPITTDLAKTAEYDAIIIDIERLRVRIESAAPMVVSTPQQPAPVIIHEKTTAKALTFDEAVERVAQIAAGDRSQLESILPILIGFANSSDMSDAERAFASGLLAFCYWTRGRRLQQTRIFTSRRKLAKMRQPDFERVIIGYLLMTPLTLPQRLRLRLRLLFMSDITYS